MTVETSEDSIGMAFALGDLAAGRSLHAALEAGEYIFHRVFGGDRSQLYERGKKCQSLRRLAAHPSLTMSVSSLWRAVAVYELSLRFPELVHYEHVGVGHISVVLGLPAPHIFQLLRTAETERWTKRKLQKVATETRQQQRGASDLPTCSVVECLRGVELLSRDADRTHGFEELSTEEAGYALESIDRIRSGLARLAGLLEDRRADRFGAFALAPREGSFGLAPAEQCAM
ncbi:MAG: hypothetical protein RJA70_4857 [Pseudomonadota bacterium]